MLPATSLTPQRYLTTIYLGGKLGKMFGEKWELMISSPAEAIRAIDINLKGKLREYLSTKGRDKYYKISLRDKEHLLEGEELTIPSGKSDIYLWPTVKGRSSGITKIILGIALLALVFFAPVLGLTWLSTGAGAAAHLTLFGQIVVGFGTALVLGGLAQLLAPHQKDNGQLESNVFQGTIAAGQQGGCVPVLYGRALVSPIPISIWFNNVDYNTTANAYLGTIQLTQLPGGGQEVTVGSNLASVVGGTVAGSTFRPEG